MIILISGKARSGKNTFSLMLADEFQKQTGLNFVELAYADELKSDLMKTFGLTRDQLYGNAKEVSCFNLPKAGDNEYWTPREIMQEMGQFNREIEPDHWVRRLFEKIEEFKLDNVIITDGRQMNEVQAVISRPDGYHIRITRENPDMITNSNHETETGLDNVDYRTDFFIENNGTLKDLSVAAKGVVKALMKIDMYN